MKASNLSAAVDLMAEKRELIRMGAKLKTKPVDRIALYVPNNDYVLSYDENFISQTKQNLEITLKRRIDEIDNKLKKLGVEDQ